MAAIANSLPYLNSPCNRAPRPEAEVPCAHRQGKLLLFPVQMPDPPDGFQLVGGEGACGPSVNRQVFIQAIGSITVSQNPPPGGGILALYPGHAHQILTDFFQIQEDCGCKNPSYAQRFFLGEGFRHMDYLSVSHALTVSEFISCKCKSSLLFL